MIMVSYFFFIISAIFFLVSLILLIKYSNDVGIFLHVIKILNIYGINFALLAICFSKFSYQFLLETIVVIVINSLCLLTLLHILFRKSNVGNTSEYAEKREKILEIRRKHFREYLKNKRNAGDVNKFNDVDDVARTTVEQTGDIDDNEIFESDNESGTIKRQIDFSTFFSDCMDKMGDAVEEPDREDVDKAIDDSEKEIIKQKRALRKKIEEARKSAYSTRKPEKVLETEKIIKEVLDKYGLTEEMLDI